MKQYSITLTPVGGLANRMKAIEAGIRLARKVGSELRILWFRTWEINCPFSLIFELLLMDGVKLTEAGIKEELTLDRPRRRNGYIPALFEHFAFQARIFEGEATRLRDHGFSFEQWARGRNVYLAACVDFLPQPEGQDFSLFRPIPLLTQRIKKNRQDLGQDYIGVHIRRTDNIHSIQLSPTSLFVDRIATQLVQNPHTKFFLATDDEKEKDTLTTHFGEHIVTPPDQADRDSIPGIQNAVVEMYTLAHAQRIWGSAQSSYSETAAHINHIPIELLTRQHS